MGSIWKNFEESQLEEIVKNSFSMAEVAKKLGYSMSGSYTKSIESMISYYNFDTSHFLGQASNKNNFDYSRFRKGIVIKSGSALPALVYKRGHKCECCGLMEWNNQPIPLQVHHKDGDRLNNEEDNLELLCPNCHALTDSYCGRNIKKDNYVSDEEFVAALKNNKNIRQALLSLGLTAKGANYTKANELIVKYDIQMCQDESK